MFTLIRCLHLAHFMQSIAMPDTYCTSTNFFPQTGHSTIRVRISGFVSSALVDIFSIHFVLAANIIDIFYKYNKYNRFYLLYLRCNREEFQESQQGQLIGCRYWLFSFIKYMREYEVGIKTANGEPVYSYEYIETLRAADRKKNNPLKIFPQKGSQERFVGSNADLTFIGGNRGGGKTFAMLLEALRDINNPYFNAAIFRKEKKDFDNLEKESNHLYSQYGRYNKSQSDMTWYFNRGGTLSFFNFSDTVFDFKERFRGKQYSYIAVDEIPQMEYAKFKFLMTSNRNARGIRNRMVGTCNPDPDSWVRKFIDWWIGEDGLPIDERDGVIRYCFMDGDTPNSIYCGDTPEEVYEQCKSIIDKHWKPEFDELGYDKVTMYIKSVTFIRGKLEENIKLIGSDPNYVSSLVQQDEEQRARDLDGNWNFKNTGDDLIKMSDMERFFNAPAQIEKGIKYVSADIAFEGGDFCVMWLWQDLHIKDVFVMRENSANTETMFVAKLQEWGVREENVIYDYWGVGQALSGHVKRAVKFTGTQKPEKQYEQSYKNIKSQCAEMLAHYIQDGKVSIEPRLLDLKFSGKKGKYQNVPLRDILMKERKCVRHKENSNIGGFELINKDGMIKAVGYSPDFFESLIYRMYFEINKKKVFRPKGMLRYVSYRP